MFMCVSVFLWLALACRCFLKCIAIRSNVFPYVFVLSYGVQVIVRSSQVISHVHIVCLSVYVYDFMMRVSIIGMVVLYMSMVFYFVGLDFF